MLCIAFVFLEPQVLLKASVIKPGIQMGKGEMLVAAVLNVVVGLFARLVEHHEAPLQPLNRFMPIANVSAMSLRLILKLL